MMRQRRDAGKEQYFEKLNKLHAIRNNYRRLTKAVNLFGETTVVKGELMAGMVAQVIWERIQLLLQNLD